MNPAGGFILGFVLGFISGRAGHCLYGGQGPVHHWVIGIPIIIAGAVFRSLAVVGFGLGLCVSDMDDMAAGRLEGASTADLRVRKEFWGTD
jgi:hypothetical protein